MLEKKKLNMKNSWKGIPFGDTMGIRRKKEIAYCCPNRLKNNPDKTK